MERRPRLVDSDFPQVFIGHWLVRVGHSGLAHGLESWTGAEGGYQRNLPEGVLRGAQLWTGSDRPARAVGSEK